MSREILIPFLKIPVIFKDKADVLTRLQRIKLLSVFFIFLTLLYSPKFLVSDVVSDDVPVALLLVRLVPHHV